MSTPQDTGVKWISLKDLKKRKLCDLCHQPMTVKQVNLIEACRACFNPQCSPQLMDVPDIEFIRRSYMDIPEEAEKTKQSKTIVPKPTLLEDEIDKVTKLFCEVESKVSHRLGEEYWNITRIPSSSKKRSEDLNGLNIIEVPSFDISERQGYCKDHSSEKFAFEDTPKWPLEQTVISNVTSLQTDVPNSRELSTVVCLSPTSENSVNEQMPASNTFVDASTQEKESEKSFDLPLSSVDPSKNEVGQHTNVIEVAAIDIDSILPACNTIPVFYPSKDNIVIEVPTGSLNSAVGNNFVSSKGVCATDSRFNFVTKSCERLGNKSVLSDLIPGGDVKKSLSGALNKENTSNFIPEVTDLNVKVTTGFRCYRPNKRRPRIIEAEIENKTSLTSNCLEKEESGNPVLAAPLSHPYDQPIEKKDSGFEKDKGKFHKEDVQNVSLQSLAVPVEQPLAVPVEQPLAVPVEQPLAVPVEQPLAVPVEQPLDRNMEPLRFMILPDQNGVTKVIDLNPHSNKSTNFNMSITGDGSDILALGKSVCSNLTNSFESSPQEGNGVSPPKPVPSIIGSTSLIDTFKGNVKPVSGFSELKTFGGAKSSVSTAKARKPRRPVKKKIVIKNTNKQSKLETKMDSNSINDDIEKAIADIQHSSEGQNIQWDQMLSELITIS